jgi:SHS2 domain-containing protein
LSAAKYTILPHTTDAYIQAQGSSIEKSLESAGQALFDTLCDVNSIEAKLNERIEVEGHDEISLVYEWLEALLLKFELDQKVYSRFQVDPLARSSRGIGATANILGELYDKRKHGAKVEVKAVTYHKMEVVRDGDTTTLRFILDL